MIPVFDFSRIIGFIKSITLTILVFLATKVLAVALVVTLVPLAILKGSNLIMEKGMEFVTGQLAGSDAWAGTFVQLTGLGAWVGERLQIQVCFQILATFIVMRFVIGFIHRG